MLDSYDPPDGIERHFETSGSPETLIEPWKCCVCDVLIHNTVWEDGKVYPAPGAPKAYFHSTDYPRICQCCLALFLNITQHDSAYMRNLQRQDEEKVARLKQSG